MQRRGELPHKENQLPRGGLLKNPLLRLLNTPPPGVFPPKIVAPKKTAGCRNSKSEKGFTSPPKKSPPTGGKLGDPPKEVPQTKAQFTTLEGHTQDAE